MKHREVRTWATRLLPPLALSLAVAAGLVACGGGGGSTGTAGTGSTGTTGAAGTGGTTGPAAMSSGAITAFGSVFVNDHRFSTDSARVIDDDTGAQAAGVGGLEVGAVVDVKPRDDDATAADELHVHPLARGFVDAADSQAGTLTVMGQKVQLTSATSFSDRRACLAAATPCAPVATAAGLAATTVNGTTTTPGSYVTVHGFLFDGSSADIVATLVSVGDAPTGSSPANFKAEGVASVAATGVSINGLKLDLSKARCSVGGSTVPCASAFTSGAVVSAGAAAAPMLPATLLVADFARQSSRVPVQAAGATVELEGVVSSVSGSAGFVVRGVAVDTSGLPAGTALPAVGDEARVVGTLSANGDSVNATSLAIEHEAHDARLGLEGDVASVSAGSTTGTFTVSLLGQTLTVNAQTRLADRSVAGWDHEDPTSNPFNITTFQSYLAASASQHVLVVAEAGSTGALVAQSLTILPASKVTGLAGAVDATPTPVNSTASGTPTMFFVHGIQVSADPGAITSPGHRTTSVAAGDQVVVAGTASASGTGIVVGPTVSASNGVLDLGALRDADDDRGRHDRGFF
jgi:hypothetical protein